MSGVTLPITDFIPTWSCVDPDRDLGRALIPGQLSNWVVEDGWNDTVAGNRNDLLTLALLDTTL